MAELVAACMASHAPLITANPESAEDGQKERVHGAMHRLAEELRASRPTALVICSNEHFTNFFYDNMPPSASAWPSAMKAPSSPGCGSKRVGCPASPARPLDRRPGTAARLRPLVVARAPPSTTA